MLPPKATPARAPSKVVACAQASRVAHAIARAIAHAIARDAVALIARARSLAASPLTASLADVPPLCASQSLARRPSAGLPLTRTCAALAFALACTLAFSNHAQAQPYPNKPIRIIVPYAAGGFSDQATRSIAEALTNELKQPVLIENRGGGGGRIGADAVAHMQPDGYNLLLTTNGTHTYMAVTEKNLSYDPIKDFTPISEIASYGLLMVINPSVPANNLQEFIAYAKKNPGKLSYASSGPGSGLHFAGEVFKSMAGIDMVHVPYKGSGPGLIDVLANNCQVIFAGEAKPHIDAGKLRFLGTTSAARDPRFPNVPTIGEAGLPGYDLTYWIGFFGPPGLPAEVRNRLGPAVTNILRDPALKKRFVDMGLVSVGSTPDQLVETIRSETIKLKGVAAGIVGGVN